jgi:hypothetical protein
MMIDEGRVPKAKRKVNARMDRGCFLYGTLTQVQQSLSHIRMEAKRDALESLVPRSAKKKPLARVNKGIPSMHQVASVA